ncbi:hypothetical protein V2J09_001308 [Rumex salicifolius]
MTYQYFLYTFNPFILTDHISTDTINQHVENLGIMVYKVARPNELLAITGYKVDDIKLTKKAFILPGQKCARIDISPVNYTFEVQAMSAEKLPFILPAVFTIGPRVDCPESLLKFAKLIAAHDIKSSHVNLLVQGVIEGETRVLASSMTMEQIFKGTKEFKSQVFDKVQLELNQFGLLIYNANVKQLVDVPGHEYFSYLGQKTQMEAANQAKVDVAEAEMKGQIGEKERRGMTVQNAAKIDAETKVIATKRQGEGKKEEIKVQTDVKIFENQKEAEVAQANADLAAKKAGWTRSAKIAEVEAAKAVAIRDAELQSEVERQNAATTTQKLRADLLSKASVEYDIKVQEANWELYKKEKEAEAELYKSVKEAEAQKAKADAEFYAKKQAADAELYAKTKEAVGLAAFAQAQGTYVSTLFKALNHDYAALRDYMMLEKGVLQDLAKSNAEAIKGLQPKMTMWSGVGGSAGGVMENVADVYTMLPPLLKTVHEQTGMLPPSWLAKVPENVWQMQELGALESQMLYQSHFLISTTNVNPAKNTSEVKKTGNSKHSTPMSTSTICLQSLLKIGATQESHGSIFKTLLINKMVSPCLIDLCPLSGISQQFKSERKKLGMTPQEIHALFMIRIAS